MPTLALLLLVLATVLSTGLAVAAVGAMGLLALPLPWLLVLVYATAAVFGLAHAALTGTFDRSSLAEPGLWLGAGLNALYAVAFWSVLGAGAAPLAVAVTSVLRVLPERLAARLLLDPRQHGGEKLDGLALVLSLLLTAFSLVTATGGGAADLVFQGVLVLVLAGVSGVNEVLRTRLADGGTRAPPIAPALAIGINSALVALLALAWLGPSPTMTEVRLAPWPVAAALICGVFGVFTTQLAKQRVIKTIGQSRAARLALAFGGATVLATMALDLLPAYGLVNPAALPWGDRLPLWLDRQREAETTLNLAVALIVVWQMVRPARRAAGSR